MLRRKVINSFFLLSILISNSLMADKENETQKSAEFDTSFFEKNLHLNAEKKNFKKSIGDYTIHISFPLKPFMREDLEILNNGKVVFPSEELDSNYESYEFYTENINGHEDYLLNLTGTRAQLAVWAWVGGNRGGGYLYVFDLNEKFKKIAKLFTGNEKPQIKDLDGDGIPEILFEDTLYSKAWGCMGCQPSGNMILKYKNGEYVMDENLMYKPELTNAYILKHIEEWKTEIREGTAITKFVQTLTDLIYTGHVNQALSFIDRIWPDGIGGKSEFINNYRRALSDSLYLSGTAKEFK